MGSGDQGSGAMFLAVMSGFKVGRRLAGGARKRNKPSSPERDMRGWGEKEKRSPLFSCQWKRGMGKETFKSPVDRLAVRLRRGIALPLPISVAPPFYSPAAGREKSAMAGRRDPSQQLCIGTQGESESPRSAHLSCSLLSTSFVKIGYAGGYNVNATPLELGCNSSSGQDGRQDRRSGV